MTRIRGIPASSGIVTGTTRLFRHEAVAIPDAPIAVGDTAAEVQRFLDGRARAEAQIHAVHAKALVTLGAAEAEVFEGHIELLNDDAIESEVRHRIEHDLMCAERAVSVVMEHNAADMDALDDDYMRERAADLRDIGRRLLYCVAGVELADIGAITTPVVVVADDLTPSETAQMDRSNILGFVTAAGGATSHVAIMARSMEIPAVVGCGDGLTALAGGESVVLDGSDGVVIIEPDQALRHGYRAKIAEQQREARSLAALRELPACTTDGHRVELCANIGTDSDVAVALRHGAEGVGLYRTEFLFMDKPAMPDEQEQFDAYRSVAEAMGERGVIVRTIDIGGDKGLDYLDVPPESNPFLGWRAIRICFDTPELLRTQLRALLRAGAFGKLRVMFPMVISLEEIRRLRAQITTVMEQLRDQNLAFDPRIEIGVMIETPAAAVLAPHLAKEVDFFSIGTNDLTQYTLAVDRGNERIAPLYDPFHPAVLHLIQRVIDAAHVEGKWAGMCGELAGDERAAVLLLGMGLDEFSMSAPSIARVKRAIRATSLSRARALAERALTLGTSAEILAILETEWPSSSSSV